MDTTRELSGVPAPPPERPLPDHWRRRAELLAIARAGSSGRRPSAAREWATPFAAAVAVLAIVTTMVIVVPRVISSHPAGSGPAGGGTAAPHASRRGATFHDGEWHRQDTVTFTGRLVGVTVNGGVGAVSVTGTSDSTVSVTERISYRDAPPRMRTSKLGAQVVLGYRCADPGDDCGVGYDIRVPRGVTVTVTAGMGAIRLSALAGRLVAHSGMGAITGTGLRVTSAKLTSNMGDVRASFATAPSLLEASTDLGSIALVVPSVDRYSVSATSDLGTTSVAVPQARSSPHIIHARSNLGSVSVSAG